jgi:putative ABC transport system permease protein
MDNLLKDIRYGLRVMIKNPAFTIVAVIALGLGIGANTAIFSVVGTVLLNPLPYSQPERLMVMVESKMPVHPEFQVAPGNYLYWKEHSTTFEQIATYRRDSYNLVGQGDPERLRAARVSAGLITMLGVNPLHGRDFLAEEDQEGRGRVIIISYKMWQRRFGGEANIVGQPITLSGNPYTVVGVMPPDFAFPPNIETDIWSPIAFDADERGSHGSHYVSVIGRLGSGATHEQASAEMVALASQLEQQFPDSNAGWTVKTTPMLDYEVRKISDALVVLMAAVAFVLLIACANVANILLARAATRQREIAIRMALGSSRLRVVRQLLTESVLLAIVGGGVGLLLAVWGIDALLALAPANLPRIKDVVIDTRALLFTLGITVLTGLVFGLAPALQASRPDLNETLKDAGRGATVGARRQRVRNSLVIAEVALALVLLVGGGLMIRSFYHLQQVSPGFNPQGVLVVGLTLPSKKYDEAQQTAFYNQLTRNVSALPGVKAAGGTNVLPIVDNFVLGVVIEGRPRVLNTDLPKTHYFAVTPGYFTAMEIPLLRGRDFTPQDIEGGRRVVIINETMAKRYFPDEDPIGKRIHITMNDEIFREIVGIVGDVKQNELNKETLAQTYEPFAQEPSTGLALIVRTEGDPTSLTAAVRSEVLALDRDQPLGLVRTFEQIISTSISQDRFSMLLLCVFATVALILAAVGLYGVMSYSVTQRTHEIGVRMALGASTGDVMRMVIGQAARLAAAGVAIGLAAAFALTRILSSLLFEVSPTDPLTFAIIPVLLVGAALGASFIPARRATRVDPMVALRYE